MSKWNIIIRYSDDDDMSDVMVFHREYDTETVEEAIGKAYLDCKNENELCVYVHYIVCTNFAQRKPSP